MKKRGKASSDDAEWVSVSYAARAMGVDDSTIRRYIKAGRFPALSIPASEGRNTYRIKRAPFEAFLQQHFIGA